MNGEGRTKDLRRRASGWGVPRFRRWRDRCQSPPSSRLSRWARRTTCGLPASSLPKRFLRCHFDGFSPTDIASAISLLDMLRAGAIRVPSASAPCFGCAQGRVHRRLRHGASGRRSRPRRVVALLSQAAHPVGDDRRGVDEGPGKPEGLRKVDRSEQSGRPSCPRRSGPGRAAPSPSRRRRPSFIWSARGGRVENGERSSHPRNRHVDRATVCGSPTPCHSDCGELGLARRSRRPARPARGRSRYAT